MKRIVAAILIFGLITTFGATCMFPSVYADDNEEDTNDNKKAATTSLTITPVSKTVQLTPGSVIDGKLTVSNDGKEEMRVSVYASPYFYSYSEQEDTYKLGFNTENSYTQLARWVAIKDANGNYVKNPTLIIPPKGDEENAKTIDIEYRITVPDSIPDGGQYAALFVQTLTGKANQNGIHTETSAGMTLYGHSTTGETITKSSINSMTIGIGEKIVENTPKNCIYGSSKVKNEGNVDFYALGKLKVEPIIGFSSYETEGTVATSIIPDAELTVEDKWGKTPDFGIYKVTWTVTAGDSEETIEQVLFLINPISIILAIIILTIIVIFVIIGVRRSKERKSRLAV